MGMRDTYIIHLFGEAIEIVDGVVSLNDVDRGKIGIPVSRNHQN